MDILILSSALNSGGAETHICELASSLAKRKNRVCVVTSGGLLEGRLTANGIRHIKMPLMSRNPLLILFSAKKLSKLLKKEHFDIIHVHSRIASLVARLASRGKDIPIVSTVHSRFKTSFALRRLSFWGSRAIAVGDDLKEYLSAEYGFPKDKIEVIPNGIDTEKFSPQKKKLQEKRPTLLFASRLDSDCSLGALLLCKIAPRLAKRFPKIEIEIAGGGKEYKKLLALADKTNRQIGYNAIKLLGFVSDMPEKLQGADVFIGVSRAALEAMSTEIPTVLCGNEGFLGVLDASNISLAAATNFCCRGSELPSFRGLYNSISTLLQMKQDERQELGEYLRRYVEKNHGLSALAQRTEDFYRTSISKSKERKKSVVLCGYYGYGNLGDEAMLTGLIKSLKATDKELHITVISHNPLPLSRRIGVKCISKINPLSITKSLKACDTLIFGGGSILQNQTSLRSLLWYTSIIKYAKRRGARVELLSNGLGPLVGKKAQEAARTALLLCDKISLRDKESLKLAKSFGVPADRLSLEDDLADLTVPCGQADAEKILLSLELSEKEFALIGINGKTPKKQIWQIETKIETLCKKGIFPVFAVMHPREDIRLSKKLSKKYGGKYIASLSPEELYGIIPFARLVLGTRYHLLYFAKRAKIPFIPFGSDPKITALKK